MICPLCGTSDAYIGLIHVECTKLGCTNYKPPREVEPTPGHVRAVWYRFLIGSVPSTARGLAYSMERVDVGTCIDEDGPEFVKGVNYPTGWLCVNFERHPTKEAAIKAFKEVHPDGLL